MGAEVTYRVRVLKTIEDEIEVDAVTMMEAKAKVESQPGVIMALRVSHQDEEEQE